LCDSQEKRDGEKELAPNERDCGREGRERVGVQQVRTRTRVRVRVRVRVRANQEERRNLPNLQIKTLKGIG